MKPRSLVRSHFFNNLDLWIRVVAVGMKRRERVLDNVELAAVEFGDECKRGKKEKDQG